MTTSLERYGLELEAEHRRRAKFRMKPHTEYQTDPIGWAVEKLGINEKTLKWSLNEGYEAHQWDGTPDPLAAAFEAIRDWKDVGVESGTGTGKSYGVAILILWFLACFQDSEVYTFAPKEDQLRLYIWKNITILWPAFKRHFPDAELTDLTIRMRGGINNAWSAHGYAVGLRADETVSSKAQGMHATDMLLVYEETPGIPLPVMEAGKNTCTAPHNLRIAIGNPNHQLDALHKFCNETGVEHVRMSAFDHPNVVTKNPQLIPGAISQKSIDKRLSDYGVTSPVFQSRVRGVSPDQASDALIRLDWLKAAAARYENRRLMNDLPFTVTGKGVDVANSEHGDRACIVDFADNVVIRIDAFACPDSNKLGARVFKEMGQLEQMRVGVDAVGVGAGTVNELRRLGKVVNALYAGGQPMLMVEKMPDGKTKEWSPDVNMFKNLRSQMYWQAREDLRLGNIDVPKDEELWEELIAPTFVDEPKTIVESKPDIKDRLGRSPDKADAFVMANWVRKRTFIPTKPELRDGQAMPWDYKNNRQERRQSGEEMVSQMIERARPNVTAGRYRVPRR